MVQEGYGEPIKTAKKGSGPALLGIQPVKHEKGLTVNQQIDAAKKESKRK